MRKRTLFSLMAVLILTGFYYSSVSYSQTGSIFMKTCMQHWMGDPKYDKAKANAVCKCLNKKFTPDTNYNTVLKALEKADFKKRTSFQSFSLECIYAYEKPLKK